VKFSPQLERCRIRNGAYGSPTGADYGAFEIEGPHFRTLRIIASPGEANENIPWEHVSVSLSNRCPNWDEMCFVKDLFWDAEETVMQLHPPKSKWINNHPYCLHLWRPTSPTEYIPLPPEIAVGWKELGTMK
jgi:hypothetical protein